MEISFWCGIGHKKAQRHEEEVEKFNIDIRDVQFLFFFVSSWLCVRNISVTFVPYCG